VDTLKNAEAPQPAGLLEQIAVAFEQDFEGSMRSFLPQFFLADADPELVQWVIDESLAADPVMASAIMRGFKTVVRADLFSAAGVPIRCINAAPRTPGPAPTPIETNRKYADYDAVMMEGVFHFPQLENPGEFNAKLRAFAEALEELTARGQARESRPRSFPPAPGGAVCAKRSPERIAAGLAEARNVSELRFGNGHLQRESPRKRARRPLRVGRLNVGPGAVVGDRFQRDQAVDG